jgi:hypothetical protein
MKTLRQISTSSDVLWCKFFFRILKNIRQQQTNPVQSCVINNSFKHLQQHKGRIPTFVVVVLFGSNPPPPFNELVYTANEGPVRNQYKCLVPIYEFPDMNLLFPKQNYNVLYPSS